MNIEELQRKVKHEIIMTTSHEQSIQGMKLLYSAALLRGDNAEAERVREQIHSMTDLALDCSSRVAYLSKQDITD